MDALFRGCALIAVAGLLACGGNTPDDCQADPAVCAGQPGTFSSQPLTFEGTQRAFFLHVPDAYSPSSAWPLLVDFHGTGFPVADGTPPEELWATPGLIAAADQEGFIAVRPRSTSFVDTDGQTVFHWDSNPGDLELNKGYAVALIAFLQAHYRIDPARIYASGFSNGTNMAAQFLGDSPPTFGGYGLVGGGIWATYGASLATSSARIYATTGYRDQLRPESLALESWLHQSAFPQAQYWRRETNAGHHVYEWHFVEMFPWLDRGNRPGPGALRNGWVADGAPAATPSLLHLSAGSSPGTLMATATASSVWTRDSSGWHPEIDFSGQAANLALAGACSTEGGEVVVVGDGAVARRAQPDGGWQLSVTAGVNPDNDDERLEAVICPDGGSILGVGPTWAQLSPDLGATWKPANVVDFGATPSVAGLARNAGGSWLGVGAVYVGSSTDGVNFTSVSFPGDVNTTWLYGVAAAPGGLWWTCGETGNVYSSSDNGQTWTRHQVPTVEDLYAVAFWDANRGMAVGIHGAAILTVDGGAHWTDLSTGLDAMLSDVTWLDANTVLTVGGSGTALTLHVP
jgi:poly(3-hydroxybutyrate) depolymerase